MLAGILFDKQLMSLHSIQKILLVNFKIPQPTKYGLQ